MQSNTKKTTAAFIRACSRGDATELARILSQGMPADTRDKYGLTGLIWAGRKGHVEIAKILLSSGADIEGTDKRGRTSLFHAVGYKRYDFVEYMATQGANLNPIDVHGWVPLDFSVSNHNVKMAGILKRLGAKQIATKKAK